MFSGKPPFIVLPRHNISNDNSAMHEGCAYASDCIAAISGGADDILGLSCAVAELVFYGFSSEEALTMGKCRSLPRNLIHISRS